MILAITLMVRDEADVIPAWLDHHVAQGFDVFVITDNGSTLRNNGNTYPGIYDHLGQYWFLGATVNF